MNNKIISIHHLRGIAGLFVVFFHFRGYLNGPYAQKDIGSILFNSAAFGVDLFFMISGFIIALSTQKQTTSLVFGIRRFFRIYPAFIVVFAVGALSVYSVEPIENLIRAMLFIHRDYSIESPGFGYNVLGPAWTLTYEIYFYFIFAIAMSISHKYRTLLTSTILLVQIFSIQYAFNGHISISGAASADVPYDNPAFSLLRFASSPILIEFVIGMVIYEMFSRFSFNLGRGIGTFVFFVSLGFFTTHYFGGRFSGFGLDKAGVISLVILVGYLIYERSTGIKEYASLNFLGDVSYSIYISHYLFINLLGFYKPEFFAQANGISKFIMMTSITLTAGTLLHYLIEKPMIRIGKSLETRMKRAPELQIDKA
ncbi:acyltransferase [uncultured Enterobacter sp.]|uniref:acyltransferase family protein n=1 Tax=uncultured Enterobacter sp. TaxID=238202 RepID=UPI00266EF992|nr:acyltransferase [uncultured Enterobacter sp.]